MGSSGATGFLFLVSLVALSLLVTLGLVRWRDPHAPVVVLMGSTEVQSSAPTRILGADQRRSPGLDAAGGEARAEAASPVIPDTSKSSETGTSGSLQTRRQEEAQTTQRPPTSNSSSVPSTTRRFRRRVVVGVGNEYAWSVAGFPAFENSLLGGLSSRPSPSACSLASVGSGMEALCKETAAGRSYFWKLGLRLLGSADDLAKFLLASVESEAALDNRTVRIMHWKADSTFRSFGLREQAQDIYGFKAHTEKDLEGTYVDIGGHVGITLMHALIVNPQLKKIVSFEPSPRNYFYLRWNLFRNGFKGRVIALNAGIGTDFGSFDLLWRPTDTTATSSMSSKASTRPGDVITKVPVLPLQWVLGELRIDGKLSVVKLDCEGCEEKVACDWPDNLWSRFGRVVGEGHHWLLKKTYWKVVGCVKNWEKKAGVDVNLWRW
eukprot:TRINITY_DN36332_c0_g1_i1.p1 TRINITY_DN36332_c0_g1~~TRINITY_DN36332_c0_g1_i1.p1  ORF type:complete len:435 (-),score=59.57 TRINITY_DN36332_c0_g1_i1:420-1724(-)